MATIDRYYFQVCTLGAERAGLGRAALLAEAGITEKEVATPGWRGHVNAMARLVRTIWGAMSDEAMGFTARGIPRGSFAFAAELARDGETVATGLARAIEFYNLVCPDIRTSLDLSDGEACLRATFLEPWRDPEHYFSEFWLIIWHRLGCWLAGETVQLLEARFDYPKPDTYLEEFRHLFPCPHHYDGVERAILMDASTLTVPVRRSEVELREMIAVAPLDIMTIPASDHSLARRVRALISRDCAMGMDEVANVLGISCETLRKRLRREGTSLSREREEVRRDAAVRALLRGHRSIEAIAADLGYAETRSFTRAFRTWTGTSPSRFRLRRD